MTDLEDAGDLVVDTLTSDTVARVEPDATLLEVARLLTAGDVGLLVVGADAVAGVISERDVVHALANGADPATTTAASVATKQIVWADATATVTEVATEMLDNYVRHILVETDGALVGIVSARDLLGAYAAAATSDDGDGDAGEDDD